MTNIRKLIGQQKSFYQNVNSVYSPLLNETVYFTAYGFHHLLYKSNRKRRNINEQYMKLKCLPYAPKVINKCNIRSEIRSVNKRIKKVFKKGIHVELVHEVLKGIRIRVIVERIGTGKYRFMSVMPHDRRSKKALANKKRP